MVGQIMEALLLGRCLNTVYSGPVQFPRLLSGVPMRVKFHILSTVCVGCLVSFAACASVTFEVCYDFGCRTRQDVSLNSAEWSSVQAIFRAESAVAEREQIQRAVARMELLVGRYTPTYLDMGGNMPTQDDGDPIERLPGQLDCIDESINTSRYLELFAEAGLLKFHDAAGRAYRRSFLSQHWAAQVREINTGRHFVVDSWFEDNGELPVMVSSEIWHDLSL